MPNGAGEKAGADQAGVVEWSDLVRRKTNTLILENTYRKLPRLVPPHSACTPLSDPSIDLSVAPLGVIILVDSSRMLAIVFELSPPGMVA